VTDHETMALLRRQLIARDKTIAILVERIEQQVSRNSSSFVVFEQNIALERVVTNKTKEVQAERAKLQQALLELQTAQSTLLQSHKLQAIGQLAAGIAHEINTPTQYVSDNISFLQGAFNELLEMAKQLLDSGLEGKLAAEVVTHIREQLDYFSTEVPDALTQSIEGLSRVASIVGAMKEFSHPSAGEMRPVNINQAIRTTVTVARNEWKYVAEVAFDLDEQLPQVPCLRDELNEVVLNLIVNAAHAIADAKKGSGMGTITIATRVDGHRAHISIADDGSGIPEGARSRVFDPFFTTKAVGKGTGQGLAIAHSVVVDKHKGEIRFDTELGKGTTFHIYLPLEEETT
jgi:two-component system, NtrC family, sensor kinase